MKMSRLLIGTAFFLGAIVSSTPFWVKPAAQEAEGRKAPDGARLEPSLLVPMRDGVHLATDLYFPTEKLGGPLPVILIRTRYNKYRPQPSMLKLFLSHGYVVAVQDQRGKFLSEGVFADLDNKQAPDGYDTIQWLSKQSWSNGNVGMYGCSALGAAQIPVAGARPPALKAIVPQAAHVAGQGVGIGGPYDVVRPGGAISWLTNLSWFNTTGFKRYAKYPADLPRDIYLKYTEVNGPWPTAPARKLDEVVWHLPEKDVMDRMGTPDNDLNDEFFRSLSDPWWKQTSLMTEAYRSDVPAMFVDSWYDPGVSTALYEFDFYRQHSLSQQARGSQYIVIGPQTHCAFTRDGSEEMKVDVMVGDRDVGDPTFPYNDLYLKWFDHWLKGEKSAFAGLPHVQYYVMGRGEWHQADQWPPPGAANRDFLLASSGHANSLNGNGQLVERQIEGTDKDEYIYDPGNPVVSRGGATGSVDQRPSEVRDDVLVYSSDTLPNGLEVTGPVTLTIFVSSSAKDTDFTAKLVDVYPDGRAFNVLEGIIRARYREGPDKTVFMENGRVYPVRLPLGDTSNFFGPGHRIRIEVSSSNFPQFDRNLNTGGNNYDETKYVMAHNTIWHSAKYPSRLTLSVVMKR